MMKLLITLVLVFTLAFAVPAVAQVGNECSQPGFSETEYCQDVSGGGDTNPINNTLQTVITILTVISGTVAVFGVIIGGYMFTTSGGNPEAAARGRRTIIYSAVGLIIVVLARIIIAFVLTSL